MSFSKSGIRVTHPLPKEGALWSAVSGCHMSRRYIRPSGADRLRQRGKVLTGIPVSVRHVTTRTGKLMLNTTTQTTAARAGLGAIGRVDIDHLQAYRLSLVLDKS